jgi:hypothetical protein
MQEREELRDIHTAESIRVNGCPSGKEKSHVSPEVCVLSVCVDHSASNQVMRERQIWG